jgi:hypothetical protein
MQPTILEHLEHSKHSQWANKFQKWQKIKFLAEYGYSEESNGRIYIHPNIQQSHPPTTLKKFQKKQQISKKKLQKINFKKLPKYKLSFPKK